MNERKINILHDIEYIDTISNDLSLENIEKFKLIKSTLDYLKKLKLITIDEWYKTLLLVRENLNLPYCK